MAKDVHLAVREACLWLPQAQLQGSMHNWQGRT